MCYAVGEFNGTHRIGACAFHQTCGMHYIAGQLSGTHQLGAWAFMAHSPHQRPQDFQIDPCLIEP